MKSALVVWGGWGGHEPEAVANLMAELLRSEGFEVEVSNSLGSFADLARLRSLSLIVPVWTMGEIAHELCDNVCAAVREDGVGIGGCHGGMCDAFRGSTEWQYMTGGQWVAHPGNDGVKYTIEIAKDVSHPITEGLADFEVSSEQYYLHTDPANLVLATTQFPNPTVTGTDAELVNPCRMPQVWTRQYGRGRVFYTALGHQRNVLEQPTPKEILRRGLLWAAK
ncbi:MAG: ThuA domain-containing protein [Armatimonadetes bacterium]|nr:ThuA domain-containing protein [Armatimonadota bacterium]